MKKQAVLAAALALAPAAGAQEPPKPAAAKPVEAFATEDQKILYSLGAYFGRNLADLGLKPPEAKIAAQGFKDAAAGNKLQVDLSAYGPKMQAFAQSRQAALASVKAAKEKKKSKPFLEKSAKQPGAKVSPSGLVYFEVKAGTGASPSPGDTVRINFRGTLMDGTEFDDSSKRREPAEFPVSEVFPCWTEAFQKMKVGGKAKLVCPSDLAYGDMGQPPKIPPGAALVFDVELLGVKKPAPSPEKDKAKAFLEKTAKEPGAQAFPSGLIFFDVKTGTGPAPSAADSVKAFYTGTLVDGTVFDASSKHGPDPLEFALNGVIRCWTEGIQKMKVGGKARLVCPADIAYRDQGVPGLIPPGATLIFDVDLAGIVKK